MATLRSKRNLAPVSRETPEKTKDSQSLNTLDPEIARKYISWVFEEIEEGFSKKLSKEFSRTESRILGALSKLDEFLLNPQVRTCSVAVPGTSRNSDSENLELTGYRSLNDPCPEAICSSHHSGHLNDSELEESHHSNLLISASFTRKKQLRWPLMRVLHGKKTLVCYWKSKLLLFFGVFIYAGNIFHWFLIANVFKTDKNLTKIFKMVFRR